MRNERANADQPGVGHPVFATTRWTAVLEARNESEEGRTALSSLCEAYYAPVFAFIAGSVRDGEMARDLTQEFFSRLLAGRRMDSVDPERGRFRSFLLGAVKHFLSDMRDHANRLKRGGGQSIESLNESTDTDTALQVIDPTALNPEREFDRRWALTLLDRALTALAKEHENSGKADYFTVLKSALMGEGSVSHAEVAARLGMNEASVKVAVHRLRRRFRELVKAEIANTLRDPKQVQEELDCLMTALREK